MLNKNEELIFHLNGINIKCLFKYKYIGNNDFIVSHIEFNSITKNKPNDLTETGYKSEWLMGEEHNLYSDLKDFIFCYVKNLIKKVNILIFDFKEETTVLEQGYLF